MPHLEREDRFNIPKVSGKRVDLFKKVVNSAMQKVREEGIIDSNNRQTVTLLDEENNREYEIIDYSVDELAGVVIPTGFTGEGLFIKVFQLDRTDKMSNKFELLRMQLPRDQDLVTGETLFSLRKIKPKDVKMLVVALSSAKKL